ncbi:hypothetical protein SBA4_860021 [Candidatus Sulfopaludibacter sp. SbA4]|nr:hypothetical protein SBA4_860021 [Candidatus Sulfopaludibacter sp. SbA4]
MANDTENTPDTAEQKRKPGSPRVAANAGEALELRRRGLSLKEIALALGISKSTAKRLVTNTDVMPCQNRGNPCQNSCWVQSDGIARPGPTEPSGEPETPKANATEGDLLRPAGTEIVEPDATGDDSEDQPPTGIRPVVLRRRPKPVPDDRWPPPINGRPPAHCAKCGGNLWRLSLAGTCVCEACYPVRVY